MTTKDQEKERLIEAEKIVISSILSDKECMEYAIENPIPPTYFRGDHAISLIQAFNEAANIMHEPTESLILDRLTLGTPENQKEQVIKTWKERLHTWKNAGVQENRESLEIHIQHLKNRSKLKQLSDIANGVLSRVHNPQLDLLTNDVQQIENFIENSLFNLQNVKSGNDLKVQTLREGYYATKKHTKDAVTKSDVEERVTTGYPELDKVFSGGFLKGTFSLIGGRPGMGKTVMMLNLALEAAKKGVKALFISIEMSLLQCFQRLLSKISDVSSGKLQQPSEMQPKDWEKLEGAAKEITEIYGENLIIAEVSSITPNQLERMVKQYKKQYNVDAVYIDYAQIMHMNKGGAPKEASDYAEISDGLRRISKSQNVAMVVGSQLSRDVEKRPDKKPMQSDLRNSGAFEQDAAVIMGLYRDVVYNKETADPSLLEVILLKNRFGELTTVNFNCDLSRQAVHSLGGAGSVAA